MVRVLQVYPQINNAGTERVIFNLYENIDRSKVQFDFLVETKGELDSKILALGGKIFYLNSSNNKAYYKLLRNFFNKHKEYSIVHTHTHARMSIVLKAAKQCGVKCRIAHSHNARNDLPRLAWIIKGITSIPIEQNANYFFACSSNAAKWLFPHIKNCSILYNGINVRDYLFDSEIRKAKRAELGLKDSDFVFIHIGRFAKQKNHRYLLEILNKYNEINKQWKALLVGVGPLQDEIREISRNYKLDSHILFLNARNDVNELLSASDLFLFPSLHEGLGIVVIEAQSSGLPCVVSDAVPNEADLKLGLLNRLALKESYDVWAKCIGEKRTEKKDRLSLSSSLIKSSYNIESIGHYMENFYLSECGL